MSFRDLQPIKPTTRNNTTNNNALLPVEHPESVRRSIFRQWRDRLLTIAITLGGHSVIVAIVLIFFFLLLQVWPLLQGADIQRLSDYELIGNDSAQSYLAIEEQGEIAVQFYIDGRIRYFDTKTGQTRHEDVIEVPDDVHITSFSASDPVSNLVIYGLSNGQVVVVKHQYKISYPDEQRYISPFTSYPSGRLPITIDPQGKALDKVAIAGNEQELSIVAVTEDRRVVLHHAETNKTRLSLSVDDFLSVDDSLSVEDSLSADNSLPVEESITSFLSTDSLKQSDSIEFLLLNNTQDNAFLIVKNEQGENWLYFYRIKDKANPEQVQAIQISEPGNPVTAANFLTGGISLLLGKQNGEIAQWFPVNQEDIGLQLTEIRLFKQQQNSINKIISEVERKGFYAIDAYGQLGVYHTTANANLLLETISEHSLTNLAVSPRADFFIAQDSSDSGQRNMSFWSVTNEHPEVSWHSLWGKVWYESYPEPDYVWQSSSAANDFEPKFSLTPLALGTLKAAFYAMLFATPLAIMGAIYTAYFMNARMRNLIKPTIEIMEALPTVIIGFMAGLWLAPFVDDHLSAVLSLLFVLPIGVLLSAWCWHVFEIKKSVYVLFKITIPEGLEALILSPVIIVLIWLALSLSAPMEQVFFAGDIHAWLDNEFGVSVAQRNSIIIGIAMGFAIIPTIFSITEDAVFNVPGHLTFGSMALGATRWQTLIRVVILTASPAIFSAIMIGFGRAIGETMIVLMATGNTPIMDFSIFQGMRTLSANIAIEIPESEVASSHYRILFLAAFILFIFTFFFNTIAEIVRQSLRRKYSKL